MPDISAKVRDYLDHPQHMGVLTNADLDAATERLLSGEAEDTAHGNALRLMLKLRVADKRILDARFQNLGTTLPVPSASCFCVLAIGKTLDEALQIAAADLDRELSGLPEWKFRLPVLVLIALDTAARKLRGLPPRERGLPGEEPLCNCFNVHESTLERAFLLRGCTTAAALSAATRACTGCQSCRSELEEVLARCRRGEFKLTLTPEDYEVARRIYGTPPADAIG